LLNLGSAIELFQHIKREARL